MRGPGPAAHPSGEQQLLSCASRHCCPQARPTCRDGSVPRHSTCSSQVGPVHSSNIASSMEDTMESQPSYLHATLTSCMSQESLHTIPQEPQCQTSTPPEHPFLPPTAQTFSLSGKGRDIPWHWDSRQNPTRGEGHAEEQLPVQLVELGHTVPRARGFSGCLPPQGNAAVKGLLKGGHAAESRAKLYFGLPVPPCSQQQLYPCHSGVMHSNPGDLDCSSPKGPCFAEKQEDVNGGDVHRSQGWSLLRPCLETPLTPCG